MAYQKGHGAVQPVPTGKINPYQTQDHPSGGNNVGEDMLAIGDQDDGFGAPPHHDQDQTQDEVDQGRAQDKEHAFFQLGDGLGVEEPGPGRVEDSQGRKNDESPFKAGGEIFDLAVAVGVSRIGTLGGNDDTAQGETGRHHIDDGLQGIREDGGGIGEPEGNKLDDHQSQTDGQGGRDGEEAVSEVDAFLGVHGTYQSVK